MHAFFTLNFEKLTHFSPNTINTVNRNHVLKLTIKGQILEVDPQDLAGSSVGGSSGWSGIWLNHTDES